MITKTVYASWQATLTLVVVTCTMILIAACGSSKKNITAVQTPLENITWNITQVNEIKVSDLKPNKLPSFTLSSDSHRISGNSGCNQFGGEYTLEKNVLTTSKLFGTEMACNGLMELEQKIYAALNQPLTLKTEGAQTILTSADGKTVMKISPLVAGN